MKRACRLRAWRPGAVIVSLVAGTTGAARAQVFEVLPLWNGATYSSATSVSSDGLAVVGEMGVPGAARAFLWSRSGGVRDLGALQAGGTSAANSVSANGSAVVGSSDGRAFRWTFLSGMQSLGTLVGGSTSAAYGVSGDGAIVVGWSASATGNRAFKWTLPGGMMELSSLPGGTFSAALGVSEDGQTIVGMSDLGGLGPHAVRWRKGFPIEDLGPMPISNGYTQAFGVSSDGTWVVGEGTVPNGSRTFRWSGSTGLVNLGGLPTALNAGARAVSGDGRVIVGYSDSMESLRATIWTTESMLLDLRQHLLTLNAPVTSWTLLAANDVSLDGKTIVGVASGVPGQRAWIARLPVVPCLANCDNSSVAPVLNAMDFQCFINQYTMGSTMANCDGSTGTPMLTAMDFMCFMNRYQAGCP